MPSKIAQDYRQIIPIALNILTERLNSICNNGTGGRGGDIDALLPDTVTKTKLIAIFAPFAFEDAAKQLGIPYQFVNANGYDVKMNDNGEVTIEEKMSLMSDNSSLATGNNHSKVKDHLHFVMKLQNVGNIFCNCFAALVAVPSFTHKQSGWSDNVTKTGRNNNGFSSLKVHIEDADKIEVIYGKIKTNVITKTGKVSKKKLTYCQTEYETINQ
jgi:hypothetical protein